MNQHSHEKWMQRCLELAEAGMYDAAPNPLVGCVLVKNGELLGEGFHHHVGGPHAEVMAVRQALLRAGFSVDPDSLTESGLTDAEAERARQLLQGCTVYINLEPCAHVGRTPACAEMLSNLNVGKVIAAMPDPNPLVAGKGFSRLRTAGIEVQHGVLAQEAARLNAAFITRMLENRPYVILKWAESADGFVDRTDPEPVTISNRYSHILSHHWRRTVQAIGVGCGTWNKDRPRLNVRHLSGKQPVPFLLSRKKTSVPEGWLQFHSISSMLEYGWEHQWTQVLIEGGPETHRSFFRDGRWDEIRLIRSDKNLGEGLAAAAVPATARPCGMVQIDNDQVFTFINSNSLWNSLH